MADIVDAITRSRIMSRVRSKDTKPEITIRKAIFSLGFRYRIHSTKLPGRPDIVLPKYKAVIFVHGCFWHKHECPMFKWPSSHRRFWRTKLKSNFTRDAVHLQSLHEQGWRVLIIWECALKGKLRRDREKLVTDISRWITGRIKRKELRGSKHGSTGRHH